MVNRGMAKQAAAFLALSLILSPAAQAASENSDKEKASQADLDNRSYLPPWMQNQNTVETASPVSTANMNSTPAPNKSAEAGDQDALKKPKAPGQGQRQHWNGFFDNPVFRGMTGVFGR